MIWAPLISREAAELSGERRREPERQRRKQPEAVRGAEDEDDEAEELAAAGENTEEHQRGETAVISGCAWRKSVSSLTRWVPHPPAAGEEGGDREHDGHRLQRSLPEEISVSVSPTYISACQSFI